MSLAVGDLNGDTKLDVLVGDYNDCYVVLGNGDGTFQGMTLIPGINQAIRDMKLADLDGDGDLDAVMTLPQAPSNVPRVAVLLNNGAGGLAPPILLVVPGSYGPQELVIGRFDADGVPDLVVTRPGTSALFYRGLGLGAFAAPVAVPLATNNATEIASADFDLDGHIDLAVASSVALEILHGNGAGGFTTVQTVPLGNQPTQIVAADFDSDGRTDILAAGFDSQVAIVRNLGGNFFSTPRSFSTGSRAYGLAVADVNQDGASDVIVCEIIYGLLGDMRVIFGDGAGGLRTPELLEDGSPSSLTAKSLVALDLNGDARKDVLYISGGTSLIARLSNGAGGLDPVIATNLRWMPGEIVPCKLDGDAFADVLIATNGGVSAARVTGTGTFNLLATQTGFSFLHVAAGDVTGDGIDDAVLGEYGTSPFPPYVFGTRIRISPGDGSGGFAPSIDLTPGVPTGIVLIGDLDGQFALDMVAFHSNPSSTTVYLSQGGGTFSSQTLNNSFAGLGQRPIVVDVNGDGLNDLLGSTAWFAGNGSGGFGPAQVIAGPGSYNTMAVGDLNADGALDLVRLDEQYDQLDFIAGNGVGTFAGGCISFAGSANAESVAALDLNGDGFDEVVVAHYGGVGGLTIHANQEPIHVPLTYCIAKLNSLGCLPAISSTGTPSASATSGFVLRCVQARNNKPGLLLYGVSGRANSPFSGGTLCVHTTVKRSFILNSAGSPSGSDCTGVYQLDLNSFAAGLLGGTPLQALRNVGTCVETQFWGRDPGFAPPNNTQLSNALEYFVGS